MIKVTKIKDRIEKIFFSQSFKNFRYPCIFVSRNTRTDGDIDNAAYVADTGSNSCDTIILLDDDLAYILTGRSYPHEKYQARQVSDQGAANYIATGYYRYAWRKGFHSGYRALVQNVKFTVWRSRDMEIMDDDDYTETGIVADNFHGWSPLSAGCVTVKGDMNPPSGDWSIADKWIYSKPDTFFDACILNFSDLEAKPALRLGSVGFRVENLQFRLSTEFGITIKVDGDFGPYTHEIVRRVQRTIGLKDDGIVKADLADILKLNLQEAA